MDGRALAQIRDENRNGQKQIENEESGESPLYHPPPIVETPEKTNY